MERQRSRLKAHEIQDLYDEVEHFLDLANSERLASLRALIKIINRADDSGQQKTDELLQQVRSVAYAYAHGANVRNELGNARESIISTTIRRIDAILDEHNAPEE